MTLKICLSVMVDQSEKIGHLIERIFAKKPDLVEFRLDRLGDFSILREIAQTKNFPAIATDRSERDPAITEKLLLSAADAGFDLLDIDVGSPFAKSTIQKAKSRGVETIVSFHDSNGTPSPDGLKKILDSETILGADVCKIVTTARQPQDNLTVLNFLANESAKTRLVSFAMGQIGAPSRILSPLFGAEFTFAAIDEQTKTAEGQLTIDHLRNAWQLLGIQ